MRRPPVVLIVVAVLLVGVGVGWASGTDTEAPTLAVAPAAPPEPVERAPAPAISGAEEVSAPTEAPAPSSSPVERVVETPEQHPPVVSEGAPGHLESKTEPLVVEVIEVATTTTTTIAPPATSPAAPSVAFSASQAYGSCDEPVPYDIFSGTAEPGSTVTISSPHGSGTAVADGSGHWERKVEFPGAPRGGSFTVTASGLGGSKSFSFTVGH